MESDIISQDSPMSARVTMVPQDSPMSARVTMTFQDSSRTDRVTLTSCDTLPRGAVELRQNCQEFQYNPRSATSYYDVLGYSAMGCAGAEGLYPRIVPGLSELL